MLRVKKTKLFIINYSSSLEKLVEDTIDLLKKKIREYEELFDIKINEQIIVNYFDNIDDFRDFIYDLRGEKESLPKYAKGTYDGGMINAFIEPEIQLKRIYTASHELAHILYMKYILNVDYDKRIVWYDEGLAQYVSGEKDRLNDKDIFKKYYFKVRKETKNIPNLNKLEHGNSFCNKDYNGYDLSYLSIRYLSEIMDKKDFKYLMKDFRKIKSYGRDIVNKMFNYFDEKLKGD